LGTPERAWSSPLTAPERAALAVIVNELQVMKDCGGLGAGGPVLYFWKELIGAIDVGIACGAATGEGGVKSDCRRRLRCCSHRLCK
jgi:hypothetical protein